VLAYVIRHTHAQLRSSTPNAYVDIYIHIYTVQYIDRYVYICIWWGGASSTRSREGNEGTLSSLVRVSTKGQNCWRKRELSLKHNRFASSGYQVFTTPYRDNRADGHVSATAHQQNSKKKKRWGTCMLRDFLIFLE
jgi:hypothetical protein